MVPLLQRVTFEKRKSNQNALPRLSAPRLGSVCPHSGIAPRAAATGHPWPGAAKPASCRFTRSAIPAFGLGLNGAVRSKADQKQEHSGLPAGFLLCRSELAREKPEGAAFIQDARVIVNDLREQARSHIWTVPALDFAVASPHSSRPVGRCALDLLLILILGAPLNHAPKPE
jgi:hypothetical protein